MSSHIQFGNAFVKKFYSTVVSSAGLVDGFFQIQRSEDNPARKWDYEYLHEGSPADCRRIYLLIQNQSEDEIRIYLEKSVDGALGMQPLGNAFLVLYPKQSISFDNYNGGISIAPVAEFTGAVFVAESFA